MPGMDGIEFLQRLDAVGFTGGVVLLSGEGLRILHTVQKLLGERLRILGALEKPTSRGALQTLLDCWEPARDAFRTQPLPNVHLTDLQVALAGEHWVLHFRPKVAFRDGALVGVEALVRMKHPQLGLVGPANSSVWPRKRDRSTR